MTLSNPTIQALPGPKKKKAVSEQIIIQTLSKLWNSSKESLMQRPKTNKQEFLL
jgi:hypothetical protein